ncbi:solute carrier family 2, facilitated glucose transporter member 1-like isoform X1 [Portunus trituberculatus]|uniref:solute carrier family 2, facilitated glucose transporter member 1-like isoform X1 n=1 Tax=Portunus trituberculatus TaxID=210409 RepID=UPI001E1D1D79|nr:solute carrier family 2, facilitated glucose transporter member 1-like isoform X1 [Portunus trituberculatus]
MSNSRSNVKHHPLVQEDSPLPGLSPIDSPVSGTPPRGLSPDRLLPEIDMEVFSTPHDPSLNLLEVPNTNWTRSPISSDPSSRASSTANLYDKPAGLAGMGLNARLAFAISAAAFGSAFQHGYNLGVINNPQTLMEEWINSTYYDRYDEPMTEQKITFIFSIIVSIYCVGGMIGGALTGLFAERLGRKGGLLINNAFALVAAVLFGFCKMAGSYEMLIAARFVIGINNGLNAGLCPMYLSEIAPVSLRGAIGTAYQLVLTISILISQIMGLDNLLGTESLWPIALALTGIPAIFQLLALPVCPESPKFLLITKDKPMDAQRALTWLRNTNDVQTEMGEMRNEAEASKLVPSVSLREITMNPTLRIPLVISVMMMVAQQLSGINAVIFFSTEIYKSAGLNTDAALQATIAMGAMNVLMTFASLVMVEKFGRKTLMLVGLSGMLVDVFLLFICLLYKNSHVVVGYLSIFLVIFFVVMFATGPGSIPWFFVTELFAQNARPTASSIAVAVNWTAAFIVGIGFLPLKELMGPFVFIIFVVLLILFILFTWFKVPETKGRSIDEITSIFKQTAYGDSRV